MNVIFTTNIQFNSNIIFSKFIFQNNYLSSNNTNTQYDIIICFCNNQQQPMSQFRNFAGIVNSGLFARKNNLLLNSCSPVYLVNRYTAASINHIYTLPAIAYQLTEFNRYKDSYEYQGYSKIILDDISFLKTAFDAHLTQAIKFTQDGGYLTAQAIANLYTINNHLHEPAIWYQRHVEPQIQQRLKYMSVSNLYHVLKGFKEIGTTSKIDLVLDELARRDLTDKERVNFENSQPTIYRYSSANQLGSNPLLDALNHNHIKPIYYTRLIFVTLRNSISTLFGRQGGYSLQQAPEPSQSQIVQLLTTLSKDNSKAKSMLEKLA